jgi:outer membrane autotransporter protein
MQEYRSVFLRCRDAFSGRRGVALSSWPGMGRASIGGAIALIVSAGVLLGLAGPADAGSLGPTFCDQTTCIPQGGPTSNPSEGISGSMQRQIEQRLQYLRCQGSDDPACAGAAAAAADSVSYEGLGVYASASYEHKDKTATDFELGFDSDSVGPTVGADYQLGTDGVIGAAFDYGHTFGEYNDGFGDFDTDDFTLIVYGSYYPTDQSFIDAAVGFGYKQFDTDHVNNAGVGSVKGNTDGFDFTADLTGGYDFAFGAFTVGPRVGLHYKRTELSAFTET